MYNGNYHNHNLYAYSRPNHDHDMKGVTTYDVWHRHYYEGDTSYAPSGIQHVHYYRIPTTFDDGHTHIIRGNTGPAIFLQNGGHYHLFNGVTSTDGIPPHTHQYYGKTSM